jgi:hypothetical protein
MSIPGVVPLLRELSTDGQSFDQIFEKLRHRVDEDRLGLAARLRDQASDLFFPIRQNPLLVPD